MFLFLGNLGTPEVIIILLIFLSPCLIIIRLFRRLKRIEKRLDAINVVLEILKDRTDRKE